MEFTVSVEIDDLDRTITEDDLDGLVGGLVEYAAAIGGAAHTVSGTMTIEADDAMLAGRRAVDLVTAIVGRGRVVGCEALTNKEFDRRQALGVP